MNTNNNNHAPPTFHTLFPDDVIFLVERSLGLECTNLFRPLNSYINRVFELEDREGKGLIVKFYRPGRWQKDAILEEHHFLLELRDQEIPVICPLILSDGSTLGTWHDIHFAVFPKCGGRNLDEFNEEQWLELGRLLGRTHAVGAVKGSQSRLVMHPTSSTLDQINYLRDNDLVPAETQEQFFSLTTTLLEEITPRFEGVKYQRIHGDLHFSNIIYRPGESFYLIDFDDMVMGPPVQDIWMLLMGYGEDSFIELDTFLEGYEMFHHFDKRSCSLIEPLRAMRYIHYLAWCGYQVVEDGKTLVLPEYGSLNFWQNETRELLDQIERIRSSVNPFDQI
jgi:Ser/Thr protein kinase RdoA (MazF antagonist)